MSEFATHLKTLRTDAGLTLVELGERTGIHPGQIAHMENGRRLPSFETVEKLLTYFRPDELFEYLDNENITAAGIKR